MEASSVNIYWSVFNIVESVEDGYIVRNTMTGSVVHFSVYDYHRINDIISSSNPELTDEIHELMGDNSIIVSSKNELNEFHDSFLRTRSVDTDFFTLHFLPTISCQLSCNYCFENGSNRKGLMKSEVLNQMLLWLDQYFSKHSLRKFKVVLFGGEPLLGRNIIKQALPKFESLANKYDLEYRTELVSNGELLNEDTAKFLFHHQWKRLQITLDGPEYVHDSIRFGSNGRPTFKTIMKNIQMVLSGEYIDSVDLRINYSQDTKNSIVKLIEYLAEMGLQDKMNLSFGIIMPTYDMDLDSFQMDNALAYLEFCEVAKNLGFEIPIEYTVGPWCVATEKHSVVVQPDGSLQKCISTVGRSKYNFSDVSILPNGYAKDALFEKFKRTDDCKKEKCTYLPICGGGCPYDALVAFGDSGSGMRFCQKELLNIINRGLLRLNYS